MFVKEVQALSESSIKIKSASINIWKSELKCYNAVIWWLCVIVWTWERDGGRKWAVNSGRWCRWCWPVFALQGTGSWCLRRPADQCKSAAYLRSGELTSLSSAYREDVVLLCCSPSETLIITYTIDSWCLATCVHSCSMIAKVYWWHLFNLLMYDSSFEVHSFQRLCWAWECVEQVVKILNKKSHPILSSSEVNYLLIANNTSIRCHARLCLSHLSLFKYLNLQ